jgi:hypothetical protein
MNKDYLFELLKDVRKSNLRDETKAWVFAMIQKQGLTGNETIWVMPNSEWRGMPMKDLPDSYIIASLQESSKSFIKQPNYRMMLTDEGKRRGLV